MSKREVEQWYQDALALAKGGDASAAIAMLARAHQSDAKHVGVRNALGVLRLEHGDHTGAIALLKPLAKELPAAWQLQLNLGNALVAARRWDDAIAPLRKAAQLEPRSVLAWYGLGRALQTAGRAADAVDAYRRALTLDPTHVQARANLSAALMFIGEHEAAEAEAHSALERAPDDAGAHFNRAMSLLARARWADGWSEYEWRERTGLLDGMRREWTRPRWTGEALAPGATVLVHAEQGFGDTLQWVRWLRLLRASGVQVVLVVPPALTSLLQESAVADRVMSFADFAGGEASGSVVPHDAQIPLASLAHALRLNEAAAVIGDGDAYLRAPVISASHRAWVESLPTTRVRAGLVWAGSGTHVNDMHRSIPVGVFETLLKRDDTTWVSLQTGGRAADLASLPKRLRVHEPSPPVVTFGETATIVSSLDLVITIDSAVAHLCGALGTPCWLLLPRVGLDWRWSAEEIAGAPWYRSVRVFRQPESQRWQDTIREVGVALDHFRPREVAN